MQPRGRRRGSDFKEFGLRQLIVYSGQSLSEYQNCLQTEKFWKNTKKEKLPNLQLGLLRDDNEF